MKVLISIGISTVAFLICFVVGTFIEFLGCLSPVAECIAHAVWVIGLGSALVYLIIFPKERGERSDGKR